MSKDKETKQKKSLKQVFKSVGIFYIFVSCMLATVYLVLVKVPNAPSWATYPVALGTAIAALVAWFNK